MDDTRIDALLAVYRDGLLEDTLPFWIRHAVDREHGGLSLIHISEPTRPY